MLPLYYVGRDSAEAVAKQRMLKFLEAMACINKLDQRIRLVSKAAKRLSSSWWFYKWRFRIRQALLQHSLLHKMQVWQKMALTGPTSKLILKEDKNEMMCSS